MVIGIGRSASRAARRRVAHTCMLGALLMVAACRQPIGNVPAATGEQANKVVDLSRDLQNVAAGRDDGTEMMYDLNTLDSSVRPPALVKALSDALVGGLRGKSLSDEQAEDVAKLLFVVTTRTDLNSKQIRRAAEDVQAALVALGVDVAAADRVKTASTALGAAVTTNQKRWYHLF